MNCEGTESSSESDDDTSGREQQEGKGGGPIEKASAGDTDDTKEHDVPLQLDPCALLLQYFLDSGDFSFEHLSYQSMFRLLLGAAGLLENVEMCSHAKDFNTLR
jgi:hypothetical protein